MLFTLFLITSCEEPSGSPNINGHWYIVEFEKKENLNYFEFVIFGDSARINSNCLTWINVDEFEISDDSIRIYNFHGTVVNLTADSLTLTNNRNTYHFAKYSSEIYPSHDSEEQIDNLIKYNFRNFSDQDSMRFSDLFSRLWLRYNGHQPLDSLKFYESIEILPPVN